MPDAWRLPLVKQVLIEIAEEADKAPEDMQPFCILVSHALAQLWGVLSAEKLGARIGQSDLGVGH
jgi:hypothetical protein